MTLLAELADGGLAPRLGADLGRAPALHAAAGFRAAPLRVAGGRRARLGAAARAPLRARLRTLRRGERRRRVRRARRHRGRVRGDRRGAGAHRVLRRPHRVDARVRDRIAAQQRRRRCARDRAVGRRAGRAREPLRLPAARCRDRRRRAGDDRGGRRRARRRARARAPHASRRRGRRRDPARRHRFRPSVAARGGRIDRAARNARAARRDRDGVARRLDRTRARIARASNASPRSISTARSPSSPPPCASGSDAGETVFIVSSAVSRTVDLLRAAGIEVGRRARGAIFVDHGSIESGFAIPALHLRVLGDREIFGAPPKRVKMRAVKEGVPVTLADLRVGDYVVHAVHGIGQYLGLRTETILGATQDYLDLRYAGSDRMLVPVTQMHQVAKYSAAEGATPRLSQHGRRRLGAHQDPRLGIAREDRRRARRALRRARDVARLRVRRGHDVADGDGGSVPVRTHPRSAEGDRREQRRHGGRAPDGPPGLRRRRLRKDRSRDARGVQGRRRQQAGRGARARPRCSPTSTIARSALVSPRSPCASKSSRVSHPRPSRSASFAISPKARSTS